MQPVNYDTLAAHYHARYAGNTLPGVAALLRWLVSERPAAQVLEVGCGTGRWLTELAPHAARCLGLDYSFGMLRQARGRGVVAPLIQGEAGALPFPTAGFELHHFPHPARFISEARRVLRPGGTLALVGLDPHAGLDRWFIYDYFPETRALDLARYPSAGQLLNWIIAAGFERAAWQRAEHIHDTLRGRDLLASHFIQKHSASQLALLTADQYAAGLARIHAALAEADAHGEFIHFSSDLRLNALVAHAPSAAGEGPRPAL
jgi:SAM-dependent methyltransferase